MSLLLEDVMCLRKDVPLEVVVNTLNKLSLRHIMFTEGGELVGMLTKTDIIALTTAHMHEAGALARDAVPS